MVDKEKDQQYDVDIVDALARSTINRLWIALMMTIILLFGSNAWWVWRESQFETVKTEITQEVEQENDGGENSFVGGDFYGSAEGQNDN